MIFATMIMCKQVAKLRLLEENLEILMQRKNENIILYFININ